MKQSIRNKLEHLTERHQEIAALLSDSAIISDQNKFLLLSKEYAQLEPLVTTFNHYGFALDELNCAKQMQQDSDAEIRELAIQETEDITQQLQEIDQHLQQLLVPKDPNDDKNTFLEVRAGTGGDEAAIFAGDLFRMYCRFAESQGWQIEIISESLGEHGGYKEIIARVTGKAVYSRLKFESGAHRVQRVPSTESQGRIHTSACTVAILPEADDIKAVDINAADLKIDTYRASGAGGQHVNKTDSAIRITHLPTGIVVECQDERSQHKNRAKAMAVLSARMLAQQQEKQNREIAENRRNLVGSGDRSERIRTYNYPQGRVTDHRINLTLYQLEEIMSGSLDVVVKPLQKEHQADLLVAMSGE